VPLASGKGSLEIIRIIALLQSHIDHICFGATPRKATPTGRFVMLDYNAPFRKLQIPVTFKLPCHQSAGSGA